MYEAKVYHTYAKSVHGIGKAVHVVARFFDAAYGGDMVVIRNKSGKHSVMVEEEFLAEYPIRLKSPWEG